MDINVVDEYKNLFLPILSLYALVYIPYGWHSVLETACNYQIMASTAYMMAKKIFL